MGVLEVQRLAHAQLLAVDFIDPLAALVLDPEVVMADRHGDMDCDLYLSFDWSGCSVHESFNASDRHLLQFLSVLPVVGHLGRQALHREDRQVQLVERVEHAGQGGLIEKFALKSGGG